MEWSIELEKALRSKHSGRSVEGILRFGPRLVQWSRESEPTMVEYSMFGLVVGEDRVFANSILLRLADAFMLGDREIRVSVVKIFLSEFRSRKKDKGKGQKGILSKGRVYNQTELLRRVKVVFDGGDVESRALALVLFGCWVDFANDSASVRYLILSSLVSSHDMEVKASLFAAGCFCDLSDDFASVVLEMLVNIVMSSETSLAVRLAGVQIFAKMGCSYSIANGAYKTGLEMLLDSLEEDFQVAMLLSLSKLASKAALLISEQVELLFSFLTREKTLRMQETALRCLLRISVKGVVHFSISENMIKTLLSTIDDSELPSALQCDALRLLRKLLLYKFHSLHRIGTLEHSDLSTVLENASKSPVTSKSILAIQILADKCRGRMEGGLSEVGTFVPSQAILLIINQMTLLTKSLLDLCQNESEVFQEVQSMLNLLLFLVGEHPDLGVLILDKVGLFMEHLVTIHDNVPCMRQEGLSVHEIIKVKGEKISLIISKLVLYLHRFLVVCLENLKEAGALTTQVFEKMRLLVEHMHRSIFFNSYTHTIYSILLHSRIIWGCKVNEKNEKCSLDGSLGLSLQDYLIEREAFTFECATKMMTQRDYWSAYKAARYAACHGTWITATYMFEQLIMRVKSNSCSGWFKCLAQFAHAERKIQLLLLAIQQPNLVEWLEKKKFPVMLFGDVLDETDQVAECSISETDFSKVLVGAYRSLCSSREMLETIVMPGRAFGFQRWYLALRTKVLGTVLEILEILDTALFNRENSINNVGIEKCIMVQSLQSLPQISFRLQRLMHESDLLATSFIGMDARSLQVISGLAFSCSLLAFITGFVLFIPTVYANETYKTLGLDNERLCMREMLIQNLGRRGCHMDHETFANLNLLSELGGHNKNCFQLQPRNLMLSPGCEAREIISVCSYAVSQAVSWQNEVHTVQNDQILSQITKNGMQLLRDVIMKWLHIPSRIPRYFFKVRPCIGSELFASNADTRNPDKISVLSGFQLSLNICLKVKNVPPDLPVRLDKLYCILCSGISFQTAKPNGENEQILHGCQTRETDDMVVMNEKLLLYATERTKKTNSKNDRNSDKDGGVVNAFLRFEINESGQGFSNCLLDVSGFPAGSYRIRWHSCCIDNQGSYWSFLPLNPGPVFTVQ